MKLLLIFAIIAAVAATGQASNAGAQTETILYNFGSSPTDGTGPNGLTLGSDGNFYGTATSGGSTNCPGGCGTVFRISAGGQYTNLYSFGNVTNDGFFPQAGLVQDSDSNFYGTTSIGGTGGNGTVFRISLTGQYTNLYSFGSIPDDGYYPLAALVQGSDSNFYGTTVDGGTSGNGTVFRISPDGQYTNLYSFGSFQSDGFYPQSSLVQGPGGNLYGTTTGGGPNGNGTFFLINSSGTYSNLYSLGRSRSNGNFPLGALALGGDGNFYGSTQYGGPTENGTVFQFTPAGDYTNLYSFAGPPADGSEPLAGLVLGSDGNFYGTTSIGGPVSGGTVFLISPSGAYANLYSFGGVTNDGTYPLAGLVQGANSNFYGTTFYGGSNGFGTVFILNLGISPVSTNCTYSISPTNASFNAAGGPDTITVTASNSCAWVALSDNPDFISITSGSFGSGNGTAHFSVAANTNATARTGTISIGSQTFTVTQSGASPGVCDFTVSTTNINLTAKGGSKGVTVKVKTAACAWAAWSNDPFILITSGSQGTGSGKVDFTVLGNTTHTALHGTLMIAGQTVTVNQAPGTCTFKLSPTIVKIGPAGGSGIVKITPNLADCSWSAVSNDPLIRITSVATSVGKGTLSYTIPANTTGNVLTGTVDIAGETFTVIQATTK